MDERQKTEIDKATILVVDDSELNRDVLHALITVLGHVALLAENGRYALTQMEKLRSRYSRGICFIRR
jgi:CheY-like chemotaxis protein